MLPVPSSDAGDDPPRGTVPSPTLVSLPQSPPEIRSLLRALGIRPQKGFGQNFLTSEVVCRRIVEAAEVTASDVVVEVGPGLGHLTRHLVRAAGRVVAVEIDRGLIRELRRAFEGAENLEILEQDVLTFDPEQSIGTADYKVVANLPYYLTSAVFRHFLEETRHRPSRLVVMVQREVGERILARPGDLNLLAISVAVFGRARQVIRVPANAFYPQPTVDSVVLRIDLDQRPRIRAEVAKFFKVVAAGFATPRKQVHNSLAQRMWMPPGEAPVVLREVGIDPTRRPQTLSIDDWDRLTEALQRRGLV
jgi:16S rRNA (adenine1518-N6/adenine1519-N6)-dimethyltransferase